MEKINRESLNLFSVQFESKLAKNGKIFTRTREPLKSAKRTESAEVIATIMSDGYQESVLDADPGDWIVTGPEGEEFVVSDKKFHELYAKDLDGSFVPRERKIMVIKNPTHSNIRIEAPWSTEVEPAYQEGDRDCFIAVGLTPDGELTADRYIIGTENILLSNYILA